MSKYPHAQEYITKEAFEQADEETKQIWEFEAELCERVVKAFGQTETSFPTCPQCKSRTFRIGDTIIDFRFPFIDGRRIRVAGFRGSSLVQCVVCGLARKVVK